MEISPTCFTFNALFSVLWRSQFGSLEDCYIRNDNDKYNGRYVARLMQIQCHGYMIHSNCNMNEWMNEYECLHSLL